MLVKLTSMETQNRLLPLISPNAIYEIVYPIVEEGGEGVHACYHLILNAGSDLKPAFGSFPPLPMRLRMVCEVPTSFRPNAGFFGQLFLTMVAILLFYDS